MWIYDPDRECKKCGEIDTVFFAQRGKKSSIDKKRQRISINNVCMFCKRKASSRYWYEKEKYRLYLKEKSKK